MGHPFSMDFGFYTFIKEEVYQGFLKNTLFAAVTNLTNQMTTLLEKLTAVLTFVVGKEAEYLQEIADLKSQVAVALSNDAADAASITAARAAADAAIAAADKAQADLSVASEALAADVAEDTAIEAALQPFLDRIPAPEPMPEPEPTPEPAPEV